MAGIRVIRAYAQEEPDQERFREMNEEFVKRNRTLIQVWGMFYPALEVLMGLVYVIVLWMGGREVERGAMTIGAFVAFNVYMGQLAWPMIALGWVVNLYQRGTASLGRLNQILMEQPEIADAEELIAPRTEIITPVQLPAVESKSNGHGAASGQPVRGACIELRNLNFAYNGKLV